MRLIHFLICLGAFYNFVSPQTGIKCDFRNKESKCSRNIPFCISYSVQQSSKFKDRALFTCDQCENGFEKVSEGVDNVEIYEGETLPKGEQVLNLCQRSESKDPNDVLYCSHKICQKELPECLKYRAYDFQIQEDVKTAVFQCLECTLLFEPNPPSAFFTEQEFSKNVCTRIVESRECGSKCQEEFPGCLEYELTSKRTTLREGNFIEIGSFRCLEAEPGYSPSMRIVEGSTNPREVKEIAIREYESPPIDCNDFKCRHVLPSCKKYFSISENDDNNKYTCLECRVGYEPKEFGLFGKDFHIMYSQGVSLELCSLKDNVRLEADPEWREEVPGCKVVSTVLSKGRTDGLEYAQYKCDQCDEGLEVLVEDDPVPVFSDFDLASNTKIRCRPLPVSTPAKCDERCRDRLSHCQEYTSVYEEYRPKFVEAFACSKCDLGFTPTHDPDNEPWFYNKEKHVCKRAKTYEPETCRGECQETFPNCDQITVDVDPEGHNTYFCNQCSEGYYPINYEDAFPGRLSQRDHPMRNRNTIYLCVSNKNEIYTDYVNCDEADESIFGSQACRDTSNCEVVGLVYNLLTGQSYYKCLVCGPGYVQRLGAPHPYDIDQRYCVKDAPKPRMFK